MRRRILFLILVVPVALPLTSLAGDGVVALQTADPSCRDDSGNIYVDCGNGTVTDNRTGLVWLKNANCFDQQTFHEAMDTILGFSDLPASRNVLCPGGINGTCDCDLSDSSSPGATGRLRGE